MKEFDLKKWRMDIAKIIERNTPISQTEAAKLLGYSRYQRISYKESGKEAVNNTVIELAESLLMLPKEHIIKKLAKPEK